MSQSARSDILRAPSSLARVVTMPDDAAPPFDADWDAADLGCGELVLGLRSRLKVMRAGEVIRVRALDPGAAADLPAWCRLTGETLLYTEPQAKLYYIRREGR